MEQLENLKLVCDKFIKEECSVEELSQVLSWIAVPEEMRNIINDAEYNLENIRFCVSDNEQYGEDLKVVNEILDEVGKMA